MDALIETMGSAVVAAEPHRDTCPDALHVDAGRRQACNFPERPAASNRSAGEKSRLCEMVCDPGKNPGRSAGYACLVLKARSSRSSRAGPEDAHRTARTDESWLRITRLPLYGLFLVRRRLPHAYEAASGVL